MGGLRVDAKLARRATAQRREHTSCTAGTMRRALAIASRLRSASAVGEVALSEGPCSLAAAARPYYASYDPSRYAPGHGGTGMIGTTVLCVRKEGKVCIVVCHVLPVLDMKRRSVRAYTIPSPQVVVIADGQVTMGGEVVKPNVKKVRRIGKDVIAGFAGPLYRAALARSERRAIKAADVPLE